MRPPVTSKDNPLIKEAGTLRMAKYRRRTGLFVIEGEKMVREAMENGAGIVHILAAESYIGQIPAYLKDVDDLLRPVSDRVYQQLSGQKSPAGVSAVCRIPDVRLDVSQCRRLILLDGVQDPGNVGTIHRICDAAGFDGMVCLRGCADPFGPKTVQASMGAVFRVPVIQPVDGENDQALIHRIQNTGFRLAAGLLDGDAENALSWSPNGGQWALVIGNESKGVSDWLAKIADVKLYIPIYGGAESLNAAVAAGILAYRMPG